MIDSATIAQEVVMPTPLRSVRRKPSRPRRRNHRGARNTLSREDWVNAARAELISGGVAAVTTGRLAKRLGATRGGFYWHFSSHADLLRALLHKWELENSAPFERAIADKARKDGVRELQQIVGMYWEEDDYSPKFDRAVRNWAQSSKEAAITARRVDERRMQVLHRIFLDLGFTDPEALVRARILYLQQVGYYTLEFKEAPERRRELIPTYIRVLAGVELPNFALLEAGR
jgi:AcrR family transcriptional regulator